MLLQAAGAVTESVAEAPGGLGPSSGIAAAAAAATPRPASLRAVRTDAWRLPGGDEKRVGGGGYC